MVESVTLSTNCKPQDIDSLVDLFCPAEVSPLVRRSSAHRNLPFTHRYSRTESG
jgi:hypothetical protein